MATIKSYSDLEQSRKLAEILPLESADNVIVSFGSREGIKTVVMPKETLDIIRTPFSDIRYITMCWSLAALLELLPEYNLQRTDWGNKTEYKIVVTVNEYNYASKNYNNPLDACVAMIEKLHELNLL